MLTHNDADDVRRLFKKLKVWKRRGRRAPHKPLLALWAIGRCKKGLPRLTPFRKVDDDVSKLIRKFGPRRAQIRVAYPFWRLRNDRVWEISGGANVRETQAGDPYLRDLANSNVLGGFTEAIYNALHDDTFLAEEIAHFLVRAHFPSTPQEHLLEATGMRPAAQRRSGMV